MQECEKLNHLSLIKSEKSSSGFYLPHHAVIKEESLTTKIRVVFDGSANEPPKEASLGTVTYGTLCASFLVIHSLHQLADDEGSKYPIDDLLTVVNIRWKAMHLHDDLIALLQKVCFPLRKWASNEPPWCLKAQGAQSIHTYLLVQIGP